MPVSSPPLPAMVTPSTASTLAFLLVVTTVFAAFTLAFARAWRGDLQQKRITTLAALALALWMAVTALAAHYGVIALLANSPKLMLYMGLTNGLALVVAFSPAGRRIVEQVPIAWLVGFQAFRLPLELVLHSFYEQGALPLQMTYSGDNFDIITGISALLLSGLLQFSALQPKLTWGLTAAFNLLGFGLLLAVMSIAVRSTPWPLRTYLNDPPVLLAFHAPYTWILPVCVAGALCGHLLLFRWLLRNWRV